jgi:flagellar motor component MotA
MYEKIVWIVGVVSVVVVLISTLINLDNPPYIGPMFQLSIIILLYSAIINVAIILPLILTVKKQI